MSSKRPKPPAPEPLSPLIDAHTHLDACGAETAPDVTAILDRAGAVGVRAVVTIADDLHTIAAVVALARRARRLVVANLVIAGTAIVVLVTWDLFWYLPLPLGVAGHEGSTVLVALNGLRLLRNRAWPRR